MVEQLFIGLVIAIVSASIIYIFKIRQLYIAVPRLFVKTKLTDNGNIAELKIFNKSKMMEEDIIVNLDSKLKYEILSTTLDELELKVNKLVIPRLAPSDEISVLLLIENGDFLDTDIKSILANTTKGKIIALENLPPNYGLFFVMMFIFISLIFAPSKLLELYDNYQLEQIKKEYSFLEKNGYIEYDEYLKSDIKKFYDKTEFPIFQISQKREGDIVSFNYRLVNNLASQMIIIIEKKDGNNIYPFILKPKEYKDVSLNIHFPKDSKMDEQILNFRINALNDHVQFAKKIFEHDNEKEKRIK